MKLQMERVRRENDLPRLSEVDTKNKSVLNILYVTSRAVFEDATGTT